MSAGNIFCAAGSVLPSLICLPSIQTYHVLVDSRNSSLQRLDSFIDITSSGRQIRQASNLTLPALDGVVAGSQDVGAPTSEKRDKSQFELEAGVQLEVPLQRREAAGKLRAAQAKLAQVAAKRRLSEQKIVAQVQIVEITELAALR
jgi:hypothetical protein